MKKVIIFVLAVALALGGIGFAHAAVTDSQDDLTLYPTVEFGDSSALEGLTARFTIACGEHLFWNTDYTFGGDAKTEFLYSRAAIEPASAHSSSTLDLWLIGGLSSSVSGGSIPLDSSGYGPLLRTVAAETPSGGTNTMRLNTIDHVSYYMPDFQLRYQDESKRCYHSSSLDDFFSNGERSTGCYVPLMQSFRFPVQPDHIMNVTVQKDDAGRVVSIELQPEKNPELHFLSTVDAQGAWFVPVFRDENGTPLAYESPQGHGIYFIPWKHDDLYGYSPEMDQVTLDIKKARLVYPLDETVHTLHMVIDPESQSARLLTLEDGQYILTTCDLATGTETARLPLLPFDPETPDTTANFQQEGEYLLFLLQDQIALTDAAGTQLLLTAPESMDQRFGARYFDGTTGDLRFDGETLILADTVWYRDGPFWAAAWRQGELCYYGEFGSSLMRGNDHWYYSYVTAEEYPVILK